MSEPAPTADLAASIVSALYAALDVCEGDSAAAKSRMLGVALITAAEVVTRTRLPNFINDVHDVMGEVIERRGLRRVE